MALSLSLLSLLSLLLSLSQGNPLTPFKPRVVGGTEVTPPFKYPWMAALAQHNSLMCGGSLISSDYVITAAHCSVDLPASALSVHLHRHDLSAPEGEEQGISRGVEKVVIHPEYDPQTQKNDFALWKLDQPVQGIQFVDLDVQGDLEVPGKPALVMGWGTTEYQGSPSAVLLEATLEIWDFSSCDSRWGGSLDSSVQICAGLPLGGKDTCQGDSGGPMLVEDSNGALVQVGIVSFGKGCAEPNTPGVYSYVYGARQFIQSAQDDSVTEGCSNNPCPTGSFCIDSVGTFFCSPGAPLSPTPLLLFLLFLLSLLSLFFS